MITINPFNHLKHDIIIIAIIFSLEGCSASNKRHSKKIHPYGYWSGKGWHPNNDSLKTKR
jgi:hypothetical protein